MTKRRVVVTGLGMLSPLALSVPETWKAIIEGVSGASKIKTFDTKDFPTYISASVKNYNPKEYFSTKELRKMDVFIQFALVAAKQALDDSGIDVSAGNPYRMGVAIGSGIGGIPIIENCSEILKQTGPRRVSPFFIPATIINMASGQVSIKYGLQGPNIAIVTACTTGTHNIGYAARTITYGDADVMLAGGTEMATSALCVTGFSACRALSRRNDEPEKASRPWDKNRDGFVLGDGAGVLVLEEYEHAKKRGARIYAELAGFGMSGDAYHMTAPDEEGAGATRSMQNALNDAAISPEEVDYINAHATSTPAGDVIELRAIKKTFGDHAYKLAVSSTKSMIGHLLGAAGAVEAIFSVLAINDNIMPPTINLDEPDDECDLNLVANVAQERDIKVCMSNSFGFGGTNGTLIFRAVD